MTKLTYQQLLGLDEARTQGSWILGEKTLTTHKGCTGSWWELESLYADPEGGDNPHWQFCFVRDESNAQFIAAAPQAIAMLKRYREGLLAAVIVLESIGARDHIDDRKKDALINQLQALLDDNDNGKEG